MNGQQLDPAVTSAIADFEKSNVPGVWATLDKNQVLADMRSRVLDPFLVNQGGQPFCGPASILFELIRKQPLRYVQICRSIFETGGFQGQTTRIKASQTLVKSRGRLRLSQADWMVLATLREAENSIFNIEVESPDIIRNLSGMTKSWEMKGWTREVLGYRKVKYIHTYLFGEYEALNEASAVIDSGGVAFGLITASGLLGGKKPFLPYPNHWITILGNISFKGGSWFDQESGRVSLDIYSWAKKFHIDLDERPFEDYFWGVVMGGNG
ncbi:hypothetical protein PI95_011765 [Hassallia byssoidea VB512170]|uniref:Uncharacterized protein n=1 Tax=Hassallia byssoidea VB512170 TaxID=1304833 RepID=A0A846H9R8_9CYAN|nr:hypothetical protein [Hassalia byssoidea]NEU73221.1 hypothetical protein [Hassalia byssoidea VB512170]